MGITTTPRRLTTVRQRNNHGNDSHDDSDVSFRDQEDSVATGGTSGESLISQHNGRQGNPDNNIIDPENRLSSPQESVDSSRPHSIDSVHRSQNSSSTDNLEPLNLAYNSAPPHPSSIMDFRRMGLSFNSQNPGIDLLRTAELFNRNQHRHPLVSDDILNLLPQMPVTYPENQQSHYNAALTPYMVPTHSPSNHRNLTQEPVSTTQTILDLQNHSNDDEEMELVVDNDDQPHTPTTQNDSSPINQTCNSASTNSSPSTTRSDNDTAYVSVSNSNEPGSSDSPPCHSFHNADSGHDSNNDISVASDIETRKQAAASEKRISSSADTVLNSGTEENLSTVSEVSTSEVSTSERDRLENDLTTVDSDGEAKSDRSTVEVSCDTVTGNTYQVVSDIAVCTQLRPLDLRESNVGLSISQETA